MTFMAWRAIVQMCKKSDLNGHVKETQKIEPPHVGSYKFPNDVSKRHPSRIGLSAKTKKVERQNHPTAFCNMQDRLLSATIKSSFFNMLNSQY